MININKTPVKDEPIRNGFFSPTWLRFLSQMGDAIFGKWGNESRKLQKDNISTEPDIEQISYTGQNIEFLFVWNNGATFNSSILYLDKSDYSVLTNALFVIENGQIQTDVAIINGKTITLPNLSTSNQLIIKGTALVDA